MFSGAYCIAASVQILSLVTHLLELSHNLIISVCKKEGSYSTTWKPVIFYSLRFYLPPVIIWTGVFVRLRPTRHAAALHKETSGWSENSLMKLPRAHTKISSTLHCQFISGLWRRWSICNQENFVQRWFLIKKIYKKIKLYEQLKRMECVLTWNSGVRLNFTVPPVRSDVHSWAMIHKSCSGGHGTVAVFPSWTLGVTHYIIYAIVQTNYIHST